MVWGGGGAAGGGSELPHIASEGSVDTEHFPAETVMKAARQVIQKILTV